MGRIAIDVSGDKQLNKKLERLKKTKIKSIINKSSRKGNKLIQAEAKRLAPKGKTGLLRRSIKVRALPRSRRIVGTQTTLAFKGNEAFYGSFVDLGTKRTKPRNFMKQAVDSKGQKALKQTTEEIAQQVEAEAKKG